MPYVGYSGEKPYLIFNYKLRLFKVGFNGGVWISGLWRLAWDGGRWVEVSKSTFKSLTVLPPESRGAWTPLGSLLRVMFSLRMLFSDHSDFLEVRASDGRLVIMLPTFHKCIIITPFIYRVLSSTQSTFLYILHDLIKKKFNKIQASHWFLGFLLCRWGW